MTAVTRRLPAVAVAAGAAVATAHGLFEVAVASHVPTGVAWLYPVVTDGLALVAYSATTRLTGTAAAYAWGCVVAAAALSGLAQAAYLAAGSVEAAPALRFGVGAWPAIACALVAHLLHLIVASERATEQPGTVAPPTAVVPASDDAAPAPGPVSSPMGASATPQLSLPPPPPVEDSEAEPLDPRVVALAGRLAVGEDLTGPAVAAELGLGERSGRRLLADARQHIERQQDPTTRQGGLHLVTTREDSTA